MGLYIACLLIVPGLWLVLAPISWVLGLIVGVVLYILTVATLVMSAPVVTVTPTTLTAGRAQISRDHLGRAEGFVGDEASLERGQRLDTRAWLVIRGWIRPVVKVTVTDSRDTVPYWLISTRHPRRLASLLNDAAVETGAAESPSDAS